MSKNKSKNSRRKSSNHIEIIKCGVCKVQIVENSDEASIECDSCHKWIHSFCAGLIRSDLVAILDDSSLPFQCTLCRPADRSSKKSSKASTPFEKLVIDELADIKEAIRKVTNAQAAFELKFLQIDKDLKEVKKENLELKKTLVSFNARLQSIENAKLKTQLFYKTTIDNFNKLDPLRKIVDCCAAVGLELKKEDVKSAVVQEKMSNNQFVTVKLDFKDEQTKFDILKNKSKLKQIGEKSSFFDVLSRENGILYKYAKELFSKGYSFVYHRGGKIFAKETAESIPVLIKSKKKVEELLKAAVTNLGFSTPTFGAIPPAARFSMNLDKKD